MELLKDATILEQIRIKDIESCANEMQKSIERQLDYENSTEFLLSLMDVISKKTKEAGEQEEAAWKNCSLIDKSAYIAREAYIAGARYGLEIMAEAINRGIDDMEETAAVE